MADYLDELMDDLMVVRLVEPMASKLDYYLVDHLVDSMDCKMAAL